MFHPRILPLALLLLALGAGSVPAEEKPLRQVIDAEVKAAWQAKKLTPAGRADDATFLRRIYLDLVGTIPTHDQAVKFLDDHDPKKREKLIEALLADPRFGPAQADVWDQVLFGRRPGGGDATRKRDGFKAWLAGHLGKNTAYDRWVGELLLAEQAGTELYFVQYRNNPEEATVGVTRVFLGTQLQCARCHDHPFESWTQRDFYGMAGFLVRLVVVESGSGNQRKYQIGEKGSGEVLFTGAAKDQKPGQKGEPIKPKYLGGEVLEEPALPKGYKEPDLKGGTAPPRPPFSRKQKLAAWVTAADNPYFARAAVNRVWGQFLGRGLVHPVDDLSEKNEAVLPTLLDTMARQFVEHKFDLKWLIRELVNSEAYQVGDRGPSEEAMPRLYERARIRPLSAEEWLAVLPAATGSELRQGTAIREYILRYFGEPTNGLGEFQASLTEHLFLNNSGEIRQMIQRRKGNLADQLLSSTEPWEKRVERLFLSVLSRRPTPDERKKVADFLSADAKPEARVEEAVWVLLNLSEFRFNH